MIKGLTVETTVESVTDATLEETKVKVSEVKVSEELGESLKPTTTDLQKEFI